MFRDFNPLTNRSQWCFVARHPKSYQVEVPKLNRHHRWIFEIFFLSSPLRCSRRGNELFLPFEWQAPSELGGWSDRCCWLARATRSSRGKEPSIAQPALLLSPKAHRIRCRAIQMIGKMDSFPKPFPSALASLRNFSTRKCVVCRPAPLTWNWFRSIESPMFLIVTCYRITFSWKFRVRVRPTKIFHNFFSTSSSIFHSVFHSWASTRFLSLKLPQPNRTLRTLIHWPWAGSTTTARFAIKLN